jgi:hypothetical protein
MYITGSVSHAEPEIMKTTINKRLSKCIEITLVKGDIIKGTEFLLGGLDRDKIYLSALIKQPITRYGMQVHNELG